MPASPRTPAFRAIALVVAALALLFLVHRQTSSGVPSLGRSASTMASSDVLSKLSVSVSQTSASPPTLTVKVTNGNDIPVTILTWDSPLDPAALSLGVVQITPAGAAAPLELPTIMFRRIMPPGPDALETLEAGATTESQIVLKEAVVQEDKLFGAGGTARVTLKGKWSSVWLKRQADITDDSLDKLGFAEDAVTGDFESNETEVKKA